MLSEGVDPGDGQGAVAAASPARTGASDRPALLLSLAALGIFSSMAAAGYFVYRSERGPEPPFVRGVPAARDPAPRSETGVLELAGSGSNLPLVRILAAAFMEQTGGGKVLVHDSIGSTGGVRAAADGVVDIGLVSRPLTSEEARLSLRVVPYARVAVVVAAAPDVTETALPSAELVAIYRGERPRWPGGGRLTVLLRERGDSSHSAAFQAIPELRAVVEAAHAAGRWRVLYDDRAMQEALASTPGAVGLFDIGAIRSQSLPIQALALDGVPPSPANVLSGLYPLCKDLAFVLRGEPGPQAAAFVGFSLSAAGRRIIGRAGYVPIAAGPEEGRQ